LIQQGVNISKEALNADKSFKPQTYALYNPNRSAESIGALPQEIILPYGVVVGVHQNPMSPYNITTREGKLLLNNTTGEITEIGFTRKPNFFGKTTSFGSTTRMINQTGLDFLTITYKQECDYFFRGKNCKFCNANPTWMGRKVPERLNKEELRQGLERVFDDRSDASAIRHIALSTGAFGNYAKEFDEFCELLKIMDEFKPAQAYICAIMCPPRTVEDLQKVSDIGVEHICCNMEVFGLKTAREMVPAKSEQKERERHWNLFTKGQAIFGHANIWTNFVLGLEPIETFENGVEVLANVGVTPSAMVFYPSWGSQLQSPKYSSVEYYYEAYKLLGNAYNDHQLVWKPQKRPVLCEGCFRNSLSNEAYLWRDELNQIDATGFANIIMELRQDGKSNREKSNSRKGRSNT